MNKKEIEQLCEQVETLERKAFELGIGLGRAKRCLASNLSKAEEYDFGAFLNGDIYVHCNCEEDARVFLAWLAGRGITWAGGDELLTDIALARCEEETCYGMTLGGVVVNTAPYWQNRGYTTVPFKLSMLLEDVES